MFHYEEPIFQKKRLLRIEMLEQLRDFPRDYLKLQFRGYSDGVLCGCQISWDNGHMEIAPGILNRGGRLYIMREPWQLECSPEDRMRYLEVQFMAEVHEEGKIEGNTRIVLDEHKADSACEMELCRFRLQEGARLRDSYENFEDYATEYDTINRIHVPFASYGQATVWPEIMRRFAEEILQVRNNNVHDISFAMNVLASHGEAPAGYIGSYLKVRMGERYIGNGNQGMYEGLLEVLRREKTGRPFRTESSGERRPVMLL